MSNPITAGPTPLVLAHKSSPVEQGGPGMGNLAAVPAAPGLLNQERLDLEEPREKKKRRQEEGKVHSKT